MNSAHEELIDRLKDIPLEPKSVLLFGPFSPEDNQRIARYYKKAHCVSSSDLQKIASTRFDVILGVDLSGEKAEFEAIFSAFKASLKPGGMLLFTQFGFEFSPHFPDMHDIGDLLLALGFENPVVDIEHQYIFGHAWGKQIQEKNVDGQGHTAKVSLDGLLRSLKKPFGRK
jgi:hypothetical protein